MRSLGMLLAGATLLFAAQALADKSSPPPPNFGDCSAAKQKKAPTDDCQECNGLAEDTCTKQWKDKGYTQSCKIKPQQTGDWREVWCKSSTAEPTKEPAAATATPSPTRTTAEVNKEGGCAVSPEGSASWLLMIGLGFLINRRRVR
jgi:hypothetical protein